MGTIRTGRLVLVWTLLMLPPGLISHQDQYVVEYRMGPNDVIDINVIGFADLNRRVKVSAEGKITLPYLGEIDVNNLTKSELEKKLTALIEEKYMQNPQVTVTIAEYQSRKVFLVGAVNKSGPYELTGRLTLLKLISQAGGLTPAAGEEIVIMRQLPDGTKTSLHISVDDLILKGDPSLDIPLQPDDIISIPAEELVQIYITGQVRTPGALSVKKSAIPTLLRAVAQAGGLTDRAAKGSVVIKRTDEAGKETNIRINIDDIMKGKKPDFQLRENDVVIVSEKFF